jgi:hypothetical protein
MNRLALIAALASIAAVIYLMMRLGRTEEELAELRAAGAHTESHVGGEEAGAAKPELEVAVYMGRIEQHTRKLWASGTEGNLPLAKFYLHEIEEAMEDLERAGINDDGVPVSEHMKTYGLNTIEAFEAGVKADGLKDFKTQFELLVNTCNSCHDKCGYPFIRMVVPTEVPGGIQDFRPTP